MAENSRQFNLGTARRPFTVEIAVNPIFDLLLATWSSRGEGEKTSSWSIGEEWLSDFRESIHPDIWSEFDMLSGESEADWLLWLIIGLLAEEAAELEAVTDALDWLDSVDLRSMLLANLCPGAGSELIDCVAAGDETELERLLEHAEQVESSKEPSRDVMIEVLARLDTTRLVEALRAVNDTAFAGFADEWAPALARSADTVGMTLPGSQPQALIERITNGIDYEIPLGVTRLVLVPSVVIRPFSMVNDAGSGVVLAYPVDDEHLVDDPDAPPTWLVNYFKALGDPRRLKLLRRLELGPADLTELSDLIGMAKTSTFHHVGVLRSAGLVTVHIGGSNSGTYELRRQAFGDADGLLHKYLNLTEF
ncbi:MAG: helix-turn-helix domain-containing protein [Acidimicrobiia bacterium]|nr:helix-turn-helix domain-containing protein [Acidimicrobiia bacterium]